MLVFPECRSEGFRGVIPRDQQGAWRWNDQDDQSPGKTMKPEGALTEEKRPVVLDPRLARGRRLDRLLQSLLAVGLLSVVWF